MGYLFVDPMSSPGGEKLLLSRFKDLPGGMTLLQLRFEVVRVAATMLGGGVAKARMGNGTD